MELKSRIESRWHVSGRALNNVAVVLGCLVLISACTIMYSRPKTREGPVDLRDLVVDASAFPDGWTLQFGPTRPPQGKRIKDELDGVYAQFESRTAPAIAGHTVLRYDNELQAATSFFMSDEFPRGDWVLTPWTVPEEWTYKSVTADRSRFACAEIEVLDRFVRCTAVAQYDEYLSILGTPLGPDHMTLEDLERILKAIDERMEHYLKTSD